MSNSKTFLVSSHDQFFVTLEIDLDALTAERAHQVNAYWGGGADRLDAEGGDVVRAVVRLLGCKLIELLLLGGGNTFDERNCASRLGARWVRELMEAEGLLRFCGVAPYPLGIRLVKADVEPPGFEEVDLNEQVAAL